MLICHCSILILVAFDILLGIAHFKNWIIANDPEFSLAFILSWVMNYIAPSSTNMVSVRVISRGGFIFILV